MHLSLYGNGLRSLDGIGELSRCKGLQSLDVGRNELTALPDELGRLKGSLTELVAEDNGISQLGAGVMELRRLQTLRVSGNALIEVPAGIGRLSDLRVLALDGNRIERLCPEVGSLARLESLLLRGNRLTAVPDACGTGLLSLRTLVLSSNALASVCVFSRDVPLKVLLLNGNRLERLPDGLHELGLERLNVANNCIAIADLPVGLEECIPDCNVFGQKPIEVAVPIETSTSTETSTSPPAEDTSADSRMDDHDNDPHPASDNPQDVDGDATMTSANPLEA